MKQLLIIVAVLMLCIGCQSTPGAGDSPATDGGNSTAAGGFGAQTVGGDQGQAQTPQTNTSGTASNGMRLTESLWGGVRKHTPTTSPSLSTVAKKASAFG